MEKVKIELNNNKGIFLANLSRDEVMEIMNSYRKELDSYNHEMLEKLNKAINKLIN